MRSGEATVPRSERGIDRVLSVPIGRFEPALLVGAGILVVIFALRIPLGLPYDEPAHWANVLFYAEHLRLPVMGVDPVRYEAQQTPLFYTVAAMIVRIVGESAGPIAVRLFNCAGHVAMVALVWRILKAVAPSSAWMAPAGAVFIAVNPMLLVMSGSIQNDTPALVLIFGAILVAARAAVRSWGAALGVGVLAGLAVLTKFSMLPAAVALVIWLLLRRRPLQALAAAAIVALLNGWWVVRNLRLYGDATGQAGVALTGAHFSNVDVDVVYLARTVATYLVLPTEYLRNTIHGPVAVDIAVVCVVLLVVAGLIWMVTRRWNLLDLGAFTVVVCVAVLSVGAWLGEVMLAWPVAFRTAYAALPLFAMGAGGAVQAVRGTWRSIVLGVLIVLLLGISGWVLVVVVPVKGLGL